MRRSSLLKHLQSDAAVCVAAIISGLRRPLITTSSVGMESSFIFSGFVSSEYSSVSCPAAMSYTSLST